MKGGAGGGGKETANEINNPGPQKPFGEPRKKGDQYCQYIDGENLFFLEYHPFHETLPRSSAFVNWILVGVYETDCIKRQTKNLSENDFDILH